MGNVDEKIKIGVLSLQAVNNYGSLLQALATQRLFEKDGRVDVFFYDYYPDSTRFFGLIKHWTNWNPLKIIIILPTIMRWHHIFYDYRKKNLNITDNRYYESNDFKNRPIKCDALCIGSDQVWNSIWNKGILPELYLNFAEKDVYKFSFASSFGRENISNDEVKITKQWLNSFNRISVRENSANIILKEQYNITNAEVLLDPTLLISAEEWRKIKKTTKKRNKYILVYNLFRSRNFDNYARKIADESNLELVRICFRYDQLIRVGKSVLLPSISTFLDLIDNAEYILTDSFHGVAFSINFNKYPICYLPPVFSTRIVDFLSRIGAEERVVKSENDFSILDKNMNFNIINKRLDKEREKYRKYFDGVCEEIMKKRIL